MTDKKKGGEAIDKRGVSDEENAELVKKYGNGGISYPFDRKGQTVAVFIGKKKGGKGDKK